jgi:CRP/FNR family transcriptional regulator, dissimilatory nitrate respiration regulator
VSVEYIYRALRASPLFNGFSLEEIQALASRAQLVIQDYAKGQVIAIEGEPCRSIGIVIAGGVQIQRVYASGKSLTLDTLAAGNSFGEAVVFSDAAHYPASVVANQPTLVAYLNREDVARLCAGSRTFLANFMRLLSNRILMLNDKIKGLSYFTVRQKVANFVLEEYRRQGAPALHLGYSRGEMADLLGVPQPSLSRELVAMREAGWIEFERKTIRILQVEALEKSLQE